MARALIETLERLGVRALPAVEVHYVGEWLVSISGGQVGRINSATTFGHAAPDPAESVARCETRYLAARRRPSFRLTHLDDHLDAFLDRRGYRLDPAVLVMTASVRPGAAPPAPASAVSPAWLERYRKFGEHSRARTAEIGASLRSLDLPHGVFTVDDGAVGVAVVDQGWVGMFDIAVDPDARRRGLGRRISLEMMAWAADRGADRAYLQVHSENRIATELYRSLGFTTAYSYWYRRAWPPGAPGCPA